MPSSPGVTMSVDWPPKFAPASSSPRIVASLVALTVCVPGFAQKLDAALNVFAGLELAPGLPHDSPPAARPWRRLASSPASRHIRRRRAKAMSSAGSPITAIRTSRIASAEIA